MRKAESWNWTYAFDIKFVNDFELDASPDV